MLIVDRTLGGCTVNNGVREERNNKDLQKGRSPKTRTETIKRWAELGIFPTSGTFVY